VLAARDVAIEAPDPGLRKRRGERLLELLGAEALEGERGRAAFPAPRAHRLLVVAVVAAQDRARALVERQRHGALRAPDHLPARLAADARREAAPVQEEDRLALRGQGLLERAVERQADPLVARGAGGDAAEIDDLDLRHRLRARAIGETELRG